MRKEWNNFLCVKLSVAQPISSHVVNSIVSGSITALIQADKIDRSQPKAMLLTIYDTPRALPSE